MKIKNILLSLGILFLVVAIGLVLTVIYNLPSPAEVAETISPKPHVGIQKNPISTTFQAESTSSTVPSKTNDTQLNLKTQSTESKSKTQQSGLSFLDEMLSEEPNDLQVCDNLGITKYFSNDLKNNMEMVFSSESRGDSVFETIRYPIRKIIQEPQLSSLMKELRELQISDLDQQEKKGFLNKIGFYSRMVVAAAQLYQNKESYEYIANRAAHLGILAKMAALKPDMAQDANLNQFCRQLENSIKDQQKVDLAAERLEIRKLIAASGLSYKQLDFDPDHFIKFSVKSSDNRFEFSLSDSAAQFTD